MKLFEKLKTWFLKFENLFMTNHECIGCSREILDGSKFALCDECLKEFEFLENNVCVKCGDKLKDDLLVCDLCKDKDYVFDRNFSVCYYTDVPARIVKRFKFNSRKYYAEYIAKIMHEKLSCFEGVDLITFVPLSKARQRQRGFNQAEEIAKELGKISGIKCVELLLKEKEGKHQAKLNQQDRLLNLKNSFSVLEENKKLIKGKTILIVDDVFTTGTTLNECSKVLKKCKAKQILTTTFAKTKFLR